MNDDLVHLCHLVERKDGGPPLEAYDESFNPQYELPSMAERSRGTKCVVQVLFFNYMDLSSLLLITTREYICTLLNFATFIFY